MILPRGYSRIQALLVDPNPNTRRTVYRMLMQAGIGSVAVAVGVKDAFDLVRKQPPDIIITEYSLEHGNGLALIQKIRTSVDSPNPFLPIIVLTSYGEINNVFRARDFGCDEYLLRPISFQTLIGRIDYLSKKEREFVMAPVFIGPSRRRRNINSHATPKRQNDSFSSNEENARINDLNRHSSVRIAPPIRLIYKKVFENNRRVDEALKTVESEAKIFRSMQNEWTGNSIKNFESLVQNIYTNYVGSSNGIKTVQDHCANLRATVNQFGNPAITSIVKSLIRALSFDHLTPLGMEIITKHIEAMHGIMRAQNSAESQVLSSRIASELQKAVRIIKRNASHAAPAHNDDEFSAP
ncbi:hypothetical protein CCP2SC5_190039 [Azospirillaceae bacterium]